MAVYDENYENALDKALEVFNSQMTSKATTDSAPKENSLSVQSTSQDNSHRDAEATTQNKGYSFYSAREFYDDIETENYLIDGFIQKEALQMIFGEPGCGKTFTAFDMSCSISCEAIHSWHGRDIEHGDVVYFVGEAVKGAKRRFRGWCVHNNVTPEQTRIHFCDEVFKLDDDSTEHCIDTTISEIRKICEKPVLIVIDTVNVFMGGDENKTIDTDKYLDANRRLRKEFGCTVLSIHHVGVSPDAKNRARGSSAFKGAMDIEIKVTNQDSIITLTQTKNKDNEKEKPITFKLSAIPIPGCFDKNGRQITTCVIEPYKSQVTAATSKPQIKLNKSEQTANRTYKEAIRRHGIRIKDDDTGHELAAVDIEHWRAVSYELSYKDKDSTKRGEFRDGRTGLCEKLILIKKVIEGADYYCLDLSSQSKADDATVIAVSMALHEHEEQQQQAAAQPEPPQPEPQILIPIEPQSEHNEQSAAQP